MRNNNNNNNNNNNSNNKIMNNNMFATNLHSNKMHSLDMHTNATAAAGAARNVATVAATTGTTPPTLPTSSPPDFDFNLPCRYFKSSFARSLSLNNASNHCKSLDYDTRSINSNDNNELNIINNHCPVLSQRPGCVAIPATATTTNACVNSNNSSISGSNNVFAQNEASCDNNNAAPALPARRLTSMAYNLELPQNQQHQTQQHPQQQHQQQQQQQQHVPLTQFRPTSAGNSHAAAAHLKTIYNQQQQQQQQHHAVVNHQQNNNNSNISNINRRNIVWPRDNSIAGEQDFELSDEAAELEMTKILNDDYMLAAEQQQQHLLAHQQQHHHYRASYEPHEDAVNVEAVLLQNQVDTLQWQLKQVETSCVMYRAVMEEVARFLDRYHSQKQQQLLNRNKHNNNGTEQITRSKSMYHVYDGSAAVDNNDDDDDCDAGLGEKTSDRSYEQPQSAYLRTRSNTNLVDLKQTPTTGVAKTTPKKTKLAKGSLDDQLYDIIAPAQNYNAFKDYTWRRSPRRMQESKERCIAAEVEDKLNQEAFRLSRTIHNLLNTSMQQPDLTQHRNSLPVAGMGRLSKTPATASIMTLHQPLLNSTMTTVAASDTCAGIAATVAQKTNLATATAAEMLFLRSMNMRESRLSLRSSTDSSVHSTSSSSKLETDEEHSPFSTTPHLHSAPKPIPQLGSTTEDESGFSSISSFQDIGVPLSSTMISTRHSLGNTAKAMHEVNEAMEANCLGGLDLHVDSRNSTLKAVPPPPASTSTTHPTNVVGVPLNATPDMQHRWDSPAKTYSSAASKFQQRFSTLSNDDSNTVLWV